MDTIIMSQWALHITSNLTLNIKMIGWGQDYVTGLTCSDTTVDAITSGSSEMHIVLKMLHGTLVFLGDADNFQTQVSIIRTYRK